MHWIRALVYSLGIRPKPGSIFYSPSRALIEASHKSVAEAIENLDIRIKALPSDISKFAPISEMSACRFCYMGAYLCSHRFVKYHNKCCMFCRHDVRADS